MYQQLRVGIERLGFFCFLGGDSRVDRAAAVEQLDIFVRALLRDEAAKVAVGNKEDVLVLHAVDDLHSRRTRHADVADRFEVGGRVDVGDHRVVGVLLLDGADQFPIHLVSHLAAGERLGEYHALVRREQLAGLRHKANAAHQDVLLSDLGCVHAQLVAVAGIVGDLADLARLIAVRQNANVLFFL